MSSVSVKTDYLISGDGIGPSKKAKAIKLNIPILNEKDFIYLKEQGV